MRKYIFWIIFYILYLLYSLFIAVGSIFYLFGIWDPLNLGIASLPITIVFIVITLLAFVFACWLSYELFKFFKKKE